MALKDTIRAMREHLNVICSDLDKAGEGNQAAARRVRTASIQFGKAAKLFRKESVAAGKGTKKGKAPAKKGKKSAPKSAPKKAKSRKKR